MPDPDTYPELGHPEVAGWVLGALDPGEAGRFEEHLRTCGECQAAVADLEPVARLLRQEKPPADLQARTLASVERAASAGWAAGVTVWWRWNVRMLSLAAAVIFTAHGRMLLSTGDARVVTLRWPPSSRARSGWPVSIGVLPAAIRMLVPTSCSASCAASATQGRVARPSSVPRRRLAGAAGRAQRERATVPGRARGIQGRNCALRIAEVLMAQRRYLFVQG